MKRPTIEELAESVAKYHQQGDDYQIAQNKAYQLAINWHYSIEEAEECAQAAGLLVP